MFLWRLACDTLFMCYVLCIMVSSVVIDDASLLLVMMDENAFIILIYNAYARAKQQKKNIKKKTQREC